MDEIYNANVVLHDIAKRISELKWCHPVADTIKWYSEEDMMIIMNIGLYLNIAHSCNNVIQILNGEQTIFGVDVLTTSKEGWKLVIDSKCM